MADTYEDLVARRGQLAEQLAAIDRQLAELQRGKRQEAIDKVRELMAQFGLTAADLGSAPKLAKPKGPAAGGKVAPKYRDPATGSTWTGRGLKPKWLVAALAEGKKIEDFAI